ncbi:MAG TPA: GNAT family N-acetyltransferase [Stellaceae bacterium]|nr:GNAT family N-acetyltransferase [Stellaceae bacterium]
MGADLDIAPLDAAPETVAALADLLIETVASGASVTFMHPLAPEIAQCFWESALAAAARGERVVLGAREQARLVATVTLSLDTPDNQQHRGEISKLMTALSHRRRGIARALMLEAERIAAARGRTLLTLDTAAEDGAAGFYERLGYCRAGMIPDYAYKPLGGLVATILYYKRIA